MRRLTTAETAKAIRLYLKGMGMKPVSVRSSNYANGSSIHVVLKPRDHDKFDRTTWRNFEQDFSYGYFNPMDDSYNHVERTITYENEPCAPGAKYVFIEAER